MQSLIWRLLCKRLERGAGCRLTLPLSGSPQASSASEMVDGERNFCQRQKCEAGGRTARNSLSRRGCKFLGHHHSAQGCPPRAQENHLKVVEEPAPVVELLVRVEKDS